MIGQKFNNRYEVREHLGDGSTATVYKAYDTVLGRDVALKVLLPHVRETTHERFFQEARAAAHLNHPNIMSIFDIGKDAGRDFLVVEYVDGDPLSHYIPSAPQVVAELGIQIANALQYAHDREIIHRDIKPANIKVTTEGQVKLMDLGLALPRAAKRVTAAGMVIGTPAYLSPEQAQGLKLDSRTDIYSLGIVLYEMATGQLPFNADDITALLLQQVKQPPPPPRLIMEDLPIALEQVILKALEKSPGNRFQQARVLAESLMAMDLGGTTIKDDPTTPNRPGWVEELRKTGQRPGVGSGKRTTRVILADDHTLLRKTLASFLEQHEDIVVLAEAGDGDNAIRKTVALLPDVLILDLNMPGRGGLEVLPEIREKAPDVKVLVLTGRSDDAYIVRALRAGAHGYILKSADEDELVDGIRKVLDGQLVLGTGVTEKVVGGLLNPVDNKNNPDEFELKVLLYVAAGFENDEIAQKLGTNLPEIIEALARAMDKLGGRDRHDAALKALRLGHFNLEDLHDITHSPQE